MSPALCWDHEGSLQMGERSPCPGGPGAPSVRARARERPEVVLGWVLKGGDGGDLQHKA